MVSPKKSGTKYSPLSRYLLGRAKYANHVILKILEIEGIIGNSLPLGALTTRGWWKNTLHTSQGQAWLNVGWKIQDVDLSKRTVILARVASATTKPRKRRNKERTRDFKLPAKPKLQRSPSKTKIAKVHARARNIERRKTSTRRYKGKTSKMKTRDQYKQWDRTAKPSKTKD